MAAAHPGGDDEATRDVQRRFNEASAKLKASVQKHVQEYESSSDEENVENDSVLSSILDNFSKVAGSNFNLGKTQHYLESSFQSGAAVCLICITSVKRVDAIWTCEFCYSFYHLVCVQKWAREGILLQDDFNDKNKWCCPKCRYSYEQDYIPDRYRCFCGKEIDPPNNAWLMPHSCGEVCGKQLQPTCGHKCLLLCHPGPCPPCPKMVQRSCDCGKSAKKPVRCSDTGISCGQVCGKFLACKIHRCKKRCHAGDCDLCFEKSIQSCICSNSQATRECSQSIWQCDKECGKRLDCGYHECKLVCHPKSECSKCPLMGQQKCPCGSTDVVTECPIEAPTCAGTCNKNLPCELHFCPHKCHRGICPPCTVVIQKPCRCGTHFKELPCTKDFTCNTKCGKIKNCGRHLCSKKCCPSSCTPCSKPCQRWLQCGEHRCNQMCHSGEFCYPCILNVKVYCRCHVTYVLVPCGRQRKTKPPACREPCSIPLACTHKEQNKHHCHMGPCPQCKEICGVLLNCKHKCAIRCHTSVTVVTKQEVTPATPCEVQAPKVEVKDLPCPPCMALVPIECVGGHDIQMQPCSMVHQVSCGRPCGRKLKCGNHTCKFMCHPTTMLSESVLKILENNGCESCNEGCIFPRPSQCRHVCPIGRCHPGQCPPCQEMGRLRCHCGLSELYIRCNAITRQAADEEAKEKMLCCGEQCIKLLKCGHRCNLICHSGDCPTDQICNKKIKVYCACRNTKKEMRCHAAMGDDKGFIVPCGEICEVKRLEREAAEMEKAARLKEEEERKNKKELEQFERKFGKKKYKEYKTAPIRETRPFWQKPWFIFFIVFLFVGIFIPFLYFY